MNWARYQLLIISGILCLLFSGGALFWLTKTLSANEDLTKRIRSLDTQLTKRSSEEIFPSVASITALEAEQTNLQDLRDSIVKVIKGAGTFG